MTDCAEKLWDYFEDLFVIKEGLTEAKILSERFHIALKEI